MAKSKSECSHDNPFAVNFNLGKFAPVGSLLNTELFNNATKYQVEMLDFLKERFEQNIKLASALAEAEEHDEALCCWLDFLRQAQIDYSDEMARLFRIGASIATETADIVEREANAVTEEFAVATAA